VQASTHYETKMVAKSAGAVAFLKASRMGVDREGEEDGGQGEGASREHRPGH
jgi:hypothetical protein